MRRLILFSLFSLWLQSHSQPKAYTTANAHAHNDYEQALPFWEAWKNQFGSMEADIFLHAGKLVVAHDSAQLERLWTLDSLYLQPLQQCISRNGGTVYPGSKRELQLMIDIKSDSLETLKKLINVMERFPLLTTTPTLKIVISGKRPDPAAFSSYPQWIKFDGDLRMDYSAGQLERIPTLSGNFKNYTSWNGKGRMTASEEKIIRSLIEKAHRQNKKIRFWNAPDNLNTWNTFVEAGVDLINTDRTNEISAFFNHLRDRQYTNPEPHEVYKPRYRNDGANKPVKNIILLIGDGTGLAQWYAAYTANKAALNVFNMRHTGLSKTSSSDNHITDSAPGATAFSSGKKTNNRAVGVDPAGNRVPLLPEILARRRVKTGIITSGDIRDATPAAFYAHQAERSSFGAIFNDLLQSPVELFIGAMNLKTADSIRAKESRYQFLTSVGDLPHTTEKPIVVNDKKAALPVSAGRGDWALQAVRKAATLLSKNKEGFLLVVGGAQVDHGGHTNKLPFLVAELLDFDKVIGEAMSFADSNGETLVIVTGDHETGGLTLTGGDYNSGRVNGQFSTDDHTAVPVPVFAYGPGAYLFDGVYENTAVFQKILQAFAGGRGK